MFWETVLLALRAIRRNALRSGLTALGIIIGVAAVIALVTIGNGTTASVVAGVSELGGNVLTVRPGEAATGPGGTQSSAKPFTVADATAIADQISGARDVAPIASSRITVIAGSDNWTSTLTGSDNAYFDAGQWELAAGRLFTDSELRSGSTVCIIGETVRENLLGNQNPLGQKLRLQRMPCEVVGLLAAKGNSGFGTDQDDIIMTPLRTFQRRIAGNTDVASITVTARADSTTAKVKRDVEILLRERRRIKIGDANDFNVFDMTQVTAVLSTITTVLTGLLAAVAGISLLVGGIGIMNIMLVSVTERTREIGIRLAIGALRGQVLQQFLMEAVVLSLLGGLVGIVLGLALAFLGVSLLKVPFAFDPVIVALAFGFSGVIGVIFGYFPARRAASLNPIEALRHE
ncbi:ABC transporter permease [Devosia sp.]|uniref:ABC transporter permease n=1 Tax=Devosia sp. TaxID=1871048 RepID=UPI003267F018